jgi:uncharacterized membrane protein HdeD (DUF308 family)
MKMRNVLKYLGYAMGLVFICTGLAVLIFRINSDYAVGQFDNIVGVVLILYGIYRIVVIFYKNSEEDQ